MGAGGMDEGGLVGRVETGAQAQPVQIASLGTSTVLDLAWGRLRQRRMERAGVLGARGLASARLASDVLLISFRDMLSPCALAHPCVLAKSTHYDVICMQERV